VSTTVLLVGNILICIYKWSVSTAVLLLGNYLAYQEPLQQQIIEHWLLVICTHKIVKINKQFHYFSAVYSTKDPDKEWALQLV
jgi:hypothetical protein